MEMINFDVPVQEPRKSRHHFLLPNCHYMLVGPTGCGKTNTLCNMLIQWMSSDRITIYTINPNQDKYRVLVNFFDKIKEESGDDILDVRDPEDVVPVEELDDEETKVVVFDDIKINNKNMKRIKEYFSLSRNKKCNCIYICQRYFEVPRYIRDNAGCVCLFPKLKSTDVQKIGKEHAVQITEEEFQRIYQDATAEPHHFMCIDMTAKHVPEMYRQNFDGFYAQ